jgi:hypothetical protein
VRPEEGIHLAAANLEIEPVDHDHAAVSLGQPGRAQGHPARGWLDALDGALLRCAIAWVAPGMIPIRRQIASAS